MLGYNLAGGINATIDYMALPASDLAAGDHYMAELSIEPGENRYITYFEGFSTAADRTATPPGVFDGELSSDLTTGYLLPGLSGSAYPDAIGYTVQYEASANNIEYSVTSHVSNGWLDTTSGEVEFTMPDSRAAAGWNTLWSIPQGAQMNWAYVSAQAGSAGSTLAEFMQWYLLGAPLVDDGQWFASSVKGYGGNSGDPAQR